MRTSKMSIILWNISCTAMDTEILAAFNAVKKCFSKQEYIFRQDGYARNFYKIIHGRVKMSHLDANGKEFVQGFFDAGKSFGEPTLFAHVPYPASAVAVKNTILWVLEKNKFFELLKKYPEIHLEITKTLSKRLYYKAIMASESDSKSKILKLLHYIKKQKNPSAAPFKIDLSRQEIANLTGLRVETAIRIIKILDQENKLKIINRKIFL